MARPGPEHRRSPLVLIFITVLIDLVGFGIILPVLPIFARRLAGGNEVVVGILLASYSAMQFLFAPILGAWSDRIGRKPVLLASVAGSCLSFLLMGYALLPAVWSLPLLFIARIADGISGANLSTAQAYIADVTPPEGRSRGMGLIGAAFGLGFIMGPAIGGVLTSRYGMSAPGFAAAAIAACNAVGIALFLPESLKEPNAERTERRLDVLVRLGARPEIALPVAVFFIAQLAASISQVAFPLFITDPLLQWHLDERAVGYLFAYIGIVIAVIQGGLIGRLVRAMGEVRVAWMGLAVLSASYFAFPVVRDRAFLYAVLAAMALGQGSVIPALNGLVSRRADGEEQGSVLGINQSMASLARVIGPLWAGWAYARSASFAYDSAAALLAAGLLVAIGLRRPDEAPTGAR